MDTITLSVDVMPHSRQESVTIWVNGSSLLDLVAETERPFAEAEGAPDIAGRYQGLPPKVALLPSKHLLGKPEKGFTHDDRPFVLVCECSEPGCWPIVADIVVEKDRVLWKNFSQPFRSSVAEPWTYGGLSFTFPRKDYEAALADPKRK